MKVKLLTISLLVVIVISLSGCQVSFTNPPTGKAKEDKALLGRWISEEKGKETMILDFKKSPGGEVSVSFLPARRLVLTARLLEIGTHSYMVLNFTDEPAKDSIIVRYAVSGRELTVWVFNAAKVEDLIKQNKISGDGGTNPIVTESADNVSRFLESKEAEEAFGLFGKFRKVGR